MKRACWIISGLLLLALHCWVNAGCAATAKAQAGRDVQQTQQQGAVPIDVEAINAEVRATVTAALKNQSAGGNIQSFDLWSVLSGAVPWTAFTIMWGAERWWGKYRHMKKGDCNGHSGTV